MMPFSKALEILKDNGKITMKGWSYYLQIIDGDLWAVGISGTRVKVEQLEVVYILAETWIEAS